MSLRQILFFLIQLHWWEYGRGLYDNQFDFASFKDPSQWDDYEGPYSSLCTRYTYDIALEPRSELVPDSMRAPLSALTPVRIKTKDVKPAPSNLTLHIFNNPGIRKGYSVSYGFARSKECLHGQDHYCITSPEFGRTRAVVLNAERFPENQNLNYIKDHFLIEDPERFVTIINEGSSYERKFYEAVFLGGYPTRKDASRSSHWIDGKTYPLEIYMYFVDETVPSMALTTVLVVLVEESDRDNAHVKPIVSTINNQLYGLHRQSVQRESAQRRRAKLFHHLMESTIYDDRPMPGENNQTLVRQTTVSNSIRNEDVTTALMEAYEKMEGVSSQLYFLDEDRGHTFERQDALHKKIDNFNHYKGHDDYYPFDNNFTYVLFYTAIHKSAGITLPTDPFGNSTCEQGTDFIYKGKHALMSQRVLCPLAMCTESGGKFTYQVDESSTKWRVERYLSIQVCKYLVEWTELIDLGYEETIKNITNKEKYNQIQHYIQLRTRNELINKDIIDYIRVSPHIVFEKGIPSQMMNGLERLMLDFRKRSGYRKVLHKIDRLIDDVRLKEGYPDIKAMRDVIHFMKYGSRSYDLKQRRPVLQKSLYQQLLPEHQKKRGMVEYGNLDITEEDLLKDIKDDPPKAIVSQSFQISWLMPPDGGYYVYDGTSPLPPCNRAQKVIVFKKPITMSRSQIETLTRVPISFLKEEDIRSTHPIIHDLEFTVNLQAPPNGAIRHEEVKVTVYFQKRNHLYLGFDGVNKNGVEQSDRIKSKNADSAGSFHLAEINLVWIALLYFQVHFIIIFYT